MIATMHGKEAVIEPAFRSRLGLYLGVAAGLDTDALGTFCGSVPRAHGIRETAIAKARLGMAAAGTGFAVASEGSYGPHPQLPFLPSGFELMVLVDDEAGLVVFETLSDEQPNFAQRLASPGDDLSGFLGRIGFPEQAVLVRPNWPGEADGPVSKGLRDIGEIRSAVAAAAAASHDGRAFVETDMRAFCNPVRMRTIGRLAERLIDRLLRGCPSCGSPGFGIVGTARDLPCAACGGVSTLVSHDVHGCAVCRYQERQSRRPPGSLADPMWCSNCNP